MERLYPSDAPFGTTAIPTGWDRPLTQEEADAANLQYPVPPYGNTYFPPEPPEPPAAAGLKFVTISAIQEGNTTQGTLDPGDAAKLVGRDTITVWPIAGRAGILDDLPARAVRFSVTGDQIGMNMDTDGLNVTGLKLLGVFRDAP